MDSICKSKQALKDEFLKDILWWKNIRKIFMVTFTDVSDDYSWLKDYVDRTVIYDAE
ncbi:hypothetical protein [Neobacillus cucumis]|uniref:hypothetical protein n=1 Tax=Neobacillus cucumis TaxID=1740721 RepID=UPI002E245B42|nr:hypothetical protein [Neobacillus cucumis]